MSSNLESRPTTDSVAQGAENRAHRSFFIPHRIKDGTGDTPHRQTLLRRRHIHSVSDHAIDGPTSSIPSWRETSQQLTPAQHATAEIVAFQGIVQAGMAEAHKAPSSELEGLHGKARREKAKEIRVQKTLEFVDSHLTTRSLAPTEGVEHTPVPERDTVSVLEENRDRVFFRAKDWDDDAAKREERRVRNMMRNLPPELQTVMQESTGLQAETLSEKATRLVKGGVINAGYQVGREWMYQLAGAAAFAADPLTRLHLSTGEVFGGSYAVLGAGLGVAMYENWKRLEAEGNSPSVPSRVEYERAKVVVPHSKVGQVLRTARGYLYWDAANEAVYYGLAGVGLAATQSDTRTVAYLAAANVAAGAAELTQAGASKLLRSKAGERIKAPFRAVKTAMSRRVQPSESQPELTIVPAAVHEQLIFEQSSGEMPGISSVPPQQGA